MARMLARQAHDEHNPAQFIVTTFHPQVTCIPLLSHLRSKCFAPKFVTQRGAWVCPWLELGSSEQAPQKALPAPPALCKAGSAWCL